MVDLNNPEIWNAIVAVLGGAGIALGGRLLVPYTGQWLYSSNRGNKGLELAKKIGVQIREPVTKLDNIDLETSVSDEGERINHHALLQAKLAEKAGFERNQDVYEKQAYAPKPSIDYVVCFSNTDALRGAKTNARVVAASFVGELKRQGRKVDAYALGSDLLKISDADPLAILNAPTQSGFNFFHCVEALCSLRFGNPTYIFFLVDSSSSVTDKGKEKAALQKIIDHNNIVPVFIEFGRQRQPYTFRNLSTFLDATYANTIGNYNAVVGSIPGVLSESARKMRVIAYD